MGRSFASAAVLLGLLGHSAHRASATAVACPTSGTATSCYQGFVGASPLVQAYVTSAYFGLVVPSGLQDRYNYNPPSSSLAALSGAVVNSSTGTSTGICATVTITCAQLMNYVNLYTSTTMAANNAEFAAACTGPITAYIGLPSANTCSLLVTGAFILRWPGLCKWWLTLRSQTPLPPTTRWSSPFAQR